MKRAAIGLLLAAGCSFALDFDDLDDLPCECLPDYVCLVGSDRCVKKHSVELFKSCTPDARNPDDLCPVGAICVDLSESQVGAKAGHRCLQKCTPSNYSTSEAAANIANQCPPSTTCWKAAERGGVCDEGICSDLPNNCPAPKKCVRFNNAGVCFTPCNIFVNDGCAGDQSCHPIGNSSVTACVESGLRDLYDLCSDSDACKKMDTRGRSMVCDRPAMTEAPRRCYAICVFGQAGRCLAPPQQESCAFSRPRVDPTSGADLGICVTGN